MADEIRDLLEKAGVALTDTNEGPSWKIDRG
jgi:cysteinyl-tRNA synthetase